MSQTTTNAARIYELDAIRGWAALAVLLFHIFWEALGVRFGAFRSVVAAPFLNDDLAVCVFFVVSGAALSAPFHVTQDRKFIVRSAIKRYPRLLIPIVAATFAVWLLNRLGLMHGPEAAIILERPDWLGLNNGATVSTANAVYFAISGVFSGLSAQRNILPFLWTMPIEMVGSMLLFLYLACKGMDGLGNRLLASIIAITFVASPYISCFFIGSLIVETRGKSGPQKRFLLDRRVVTAAMLLCLLYSGAAVIFRSELLRYPNAIVGSAIVFYCLNIEAVARRLSTSTVSRLLGKISFPLYLSHYAVLGAVFSPLIMAYEADLTILTAGMIGLATAIVAILVAFAFLPVEQASHRLSKRLSDFILNVDGRTQREFGHGPASTSLPET
jgi:peptidoglycan/LPS O-acetylase OafA/YrhL